MNHLAASSHAGAGWRRAAVAGLFLIVVIAVLCFWLFRGASSAASLLEQAKTLQARGELIRAKEQALQALQADADLHEARLIAAECAEDLKRYDEAAELLAGVPESASELWLPAQSMLATLNHHHLLRLSDAEAAYRAVLSVDPDHVEANRGLAQVLLLCARKFEAIPYILRLIPLNAADDFLIILAKPGTILHQEGLLEQARKADPADPNPLVGLAWQSAEQGDFEAAIKLLESALQMRADFGPAQAALGEQYANANRLADLQAWSNSLSKNAEAFPQTWLARAQLADRLDHTEWAVRCYGEASRLAPDLKMPNAQLARLLSRLGKEDLAERFSRRVLTLEALQDKQNQFRESLEFLVELVDAYESAGRIWEAYAWSRAARTLDRPGGRLWDKHQDLESRVKGLPYKLTIDESNEALRLRLEDFSLSSPEIPLQASTTEADSPKPSSRQFTFSDVSEAVGLKFRYFNGVAGETKHRIFEFTGGGVGVIDMDADGSPDLFLTQGQHWPPESLDPNLVDTLYRNRSGVGFVDVTQLANLHETGFGQGVAAGDVNSDGFPDLYVANLGQNVLWLNNGDGTFTDVSDEAKVSGASVWTTSCLIADLTGDGLADLYEANYLAGPDLLERVCRFDDGSERQCLPFEFSAEPDRLLVNVGDGTYSDATSAAFSEVPEGKGLGLAAWDADGNGRLSLLVANDTTPNLYFSPIADQGNGQIFEERGIVSGIALNAEGKAEGCMGIALNDMDGNGQLDVHITNFYHESNVFYECLSPGMFEDATRKVGLVTPTMEFLGFGTVFFDVDSDGTMELFVANGHVDDLTRLGKPYRMRSQLFEWTGQQFLEVPAERLGEYFEKQWLGRAVARLDWNDDRRDDLVIGNLHDPTVLLSNTTPPVGHSLSFRFRATSSHRDAIGTTVTLTADGVSTLQQLTAGDGYQASHERRMRFCVPNADRVEKVQVKWPSGLTQEFHDLPVDSDWILAEGEPLRRAAEMSSEQQR